MFWCKNLLWGEEPLTYGCCCLGSRQARTVAECKDIGILVMYECALVDINEAGSISYP